MEDGGKDTATMTEIHREGVYRGFQKYGLTMLLHVQKHGIFKTSISLVCTYKVYQSTIPFITLVCTYTCKALILQYFWYFVSVIVCNISIRALYAYVYVHMP